MKRFILRRLEDVSGVSGTGDVAEGVVFHDGQVALSWHGKYHSLEIHPSLKTMEGIHGHEGKTRIVAQEGNPEIMLWTLNIVKSLLSLRREPTRDDLQRILEILEKEAVSK